MEDVPQTLTTATPGEAEHAYKACFGLDPEGIATPQSVAMAGASFRLQTKTGELVYTVSKIGREMWIHGAAGAGHGMTRAGLIVIEAMAKANGCGTVAFQTVRRGLVKLAAAAGYETAGAIGTGQILRKKLA